MSDMNYTPTYCINHPNRETSLRCNRCDRLICSECAMLTPTGYRCKECVRGQQKIFETAQWIDYPLAIGLAVVMGFIGSIIAGFLGFFTIFIAPMAGVAIAEAVRWVVRRRRSRLLFQLTTGGAIVGSLLRLLPSLLGLLFLSGISSGAGLNLLGLLWPAIYTFLMASTLYYRLSGIQIR